MGYEPVFRFGDRKVLRIRRLAFSSHLSALTAAGFDEQCAKMVKICSECHSTKFAGGELEKGDRMIRETDKLLAEAIRIIAGL